MLVLAMEFSRSAPAPEPHGPGREEGADAPPPAPDGTDGGEALPHNGTEEVRPAAWRGSRRDVTSTNLPAGSGAGGRVASGQQRVPATGLKSGRRSSDSLERR